MHIKCLTLKSFRNISELRLEEISRGVNVFCGENAQGKTNLVEAVNYLSCARSFRGTPDEEMIKEGNDASFLSCGFASEYYNGSIEAAIYKNSRRAVKINGAPAKRMSDMLGRLNTVVFAPEDIRAIKDRPQQRRRIIDIEISKMKPAYYLALQRYSSIVKNKNRLLKTGGETALIEAFNEQLAECGAEIVEKRRWFLSAVGDIAEQAQQSLTGQEEQLKLRYRCCAEGEDIKEELKSRLNAALEKEKLFKMCLFGPHREDIELFINGRSVKSMASQGQQRTAMIAFKLGCAGLAEKETLEKPVLLLDDVFSELDKSRRERLLGIVGDFQVFITATDAVPFDKPEGVNFYRVADGHIF